MICIQELYKRFGKNQVLNHINLKIDQPGVYAVLGPNGSGKTTLLKTILGMVLPNGGEIRIKGQSIARKWNYREDIGYLPQIARFPENLTVQELLEMICQFRSRKADQEPLIERFEMGPYLNKRLGTLSGGTLQKANLIQAFMFDSPILMLDEPTAGLDPIAMVSLKELIRAEKARGKTILITSHIMSFVEEMADQIVFLLEGDIRFRGSISDLTDTYGGADIEQAIAHLLKKEVNAIPTELPARTSDPLIFNAYTQPSP